MNTPFFGVATFIEWIILYLTRGDTRVNDRMTSLTMGAIGRFPVVLRLHLVKDRVLL